MTATIEPDALDGIEQMGMDIETDDGPNLDLGKVAVLVALHCGAWRAGGVDQEASVETAQRYESNRDLSHVWRRLMPRKSSYDALWAAISYAYKACEAQTLEWHGKKRILPTDNFEQFAQVMRDCKFRCEEANRAFCEDYPLLRDQVRQTVTGLGKLFRESDFPATVEGRFYWILDVEPVATANDFRVNLSEEVLTHYRQKLERIQEAQTVTAMRKKWKELYDATKGLVSTLENPKGKVYEATLTSLEKLCGLMDRLNLTDDPDLFKMTQALREEVLQFTAFDLRGPTHLRGVVAAKADEIAETMRDFIG